MGTVACLLGGCHHATLSSHPRPLPPVKLAPVRPRSPGLASATIEDAGASPFEVAVTGEGIRPQRLGRSWLLTRDESYAQHDASGWRLGCLPPESALAGSPEHLWMTTKFNSYSACHEDGDLMRKDGERWSFVRTLDVHDVRIESWIGGSTLALYVPFTEGPPWGYALAVLDGKAVAPRVMSAQGAHQPSGPACTSRLVQATSLVTFASGEVFVLALNECPEASDGQSILAERWAAGARQSSVDRLPLDEPDLDLDPAISQEPIPLTAPSPSNVWVSGVLPGTTEPALAHFDGRDWSLVVTNLPGSVTSVAWRGAVEGGGSDAQLWMVSRGRVYRGRPEWQPVEPVPLPGGVGDAVAVWVDDANAVWVGAEHAVVATGEWAKPLVWPAPAENDCKVSLPPRPAAPRGMSGAVKSASRGGCGDDKEHSVPAGAL